MKLSKLLLGVALCIVTIALIILTANAIIHFVNK